MAFDLFYVSDSNDPERSLVKSFTDDSPADPPILFRSDYRRYRLHRLVRNPVPTPGRPFLYGARPLTLRLGAYVIDAVPDSGTYVLTGPNGGTATINQTDSQATIQAALRAGWTGGSDILATVYSTGGVSTYYQIDWGNTGAEAGVPTADASGLVPGGSSVSITNSQDGTSLLNEKWEVRLHKAFPFLNSSWTAFPGVTTAATLVQVGSSTARKVYTLTWNSDAVDGATYWLVSDGSTSTTVQISHSATADEMVAAFAAHSGLDGDAEVSVIQNGPGNYTVTFPLALANGPTIGATASSNTLVVPVGDYADVAVSTAGANAILGEEDEAEVIFEIEITDTSDRPETVVQVPTTLKKDVLGNAGGYQTGADVFITASTILGGTLSYVAAAGSVGSPSYSFTGDSNTGIYWIGADQIGFAAGGSLRATLNAGGLSINSGLSAPLNSVITGNHTAGIDDYVMIFTLGTTATLALPAVASHLNRIYHVVNAVASSDNVTINPSGAELIDGASTLDVIPGDSLMIHCDGAAWHVIHKSTL